MGMQLAAWGGLCLVFAVLMRNRPLVCVVFVLSLWFLVPAVGSPLITGQLSGPVSFHAATWLIVAVAAVQLVHKTDTFLGVIARHFLLFLVLGVVVCAAILATKTGAGGSGLVILVDQVIAPVLFFAVIVSVGSVDPGLNLKLRRTLLVLASVVSLVALAQWLTKSVLFYEQGFARQYWFNPDDNRWMGTLDQPLALSFVLSAIAPLLVGLRNAWLQLSLLVLFAVGVLVSQSRVGILVFAVITVYVVVRSRTRFVLKAFMMLALGAAGYLIFASSLVAGIQSRFADDTGSTAARQAAIGFFVDSWRQYLLAGDGISSSYQVGQAAGLGTSLESSILMYAIDIGIFFALLYFGAMGVIVLRAIWIQRAPGLVLAGILVVLIPQTYSALATRSVAGILVWTILAMVVVATDDAARKPIRPARAEYVWNSSPVDPVGSL